MKKNAVLIIAFVLCLFQAFPQQSSLPLPAATLIAHHLITVSFNTTTVLVFPAPVRPVDRGDRDIIAQKQPGVDNVLKLKAARKYFPITNLHVFTADGRIYAFDVAYTDSLATTHDLGALTGAGDSTSMDGIIQLSQQPVNTAEMAQFVSALKALPRIRRHPADHAYKMTFRLEAVGLAGPLILFRFRIANHSNLDYHLDFVRMYIRDKQKVKRTSIQEHEITPTFQDSAPVIPGKASSILVFAVPAFTLSDGKQLLVEAYEKNGGRSLKLYIKNKSLLKAKKL